MPSKLSQSALVRELFEVSKDVRAWAEARAMESGRDRCSLQGMCAIAAYELFARLTQHPLLGGHSIRFSKSDFHAFVMVDALTIDVTATQFVNTDSVEGVWIVDLTDEPDPGVWCATEFASSLDDVRQLECWKGWPQCELPLPMQGG